MQAAPYFSISPVRTSRDESHRVGIWLHKEMQPFIEEGRIGHYRGGHPGALQDQLLIFLEDNKDRDLVRIIVTCHGKRDSGTFADYSGRTNFRWTANGLWRGAFWFWGLRQLLQHTKPKAVEIIFAQCYGKYMADSLNAIISQEQPIAGVSVTVIGLSYGVTWRKLGPKDAKLSQMAYHQQLLEHFKGLPISVKDPANLSSDEDTEDPDEDQLAVY
eukprot:TRINITY_DN28810_c0_g1_i1.p1 TRINITY_DN28810_c0_g1~~TRINITY_DN28810_c0_g1_i1.p1  ORF type:complete len:216 (+),score=10.37 TRINITY_DN28810_c0_g1_i1:95-742(+)